MRLRSTLVPRFRGGGNAATPLPVSLAQPQVQTTAPRVARGKPNRRALGMTALCNSRVSHRGRGALGTRPVLIGVGSVTILQIAFTYALPLQALFATRPLDPVADGVPILLVGLALMLLLEGEKALRRWADAFRAEPLRGTQGNRLSAAQSRRGGRPRTTSPRRTHPTEHHAAAFRSPRLKRNGMPQLFSPGADRRLRIALVLCACGLLVGGAAAFAFARSDRVWGVAAAAPQPIPFSHAIHAGEIGLDCRYCHAGVERDAAAGMPTGETCLGCHSQVWNVSAQFAPLATALALGTPVGWRSVHRLPDHVRFHHGAHVAAGLGCGSCHGDVAGMPRTVKVETLSMGWCLDCHRSTRPAVGNEPRFEHAGIEVSPLTRCSTCHR